MMTDQETLWSEVIYDNPTNPNVLEYLRTGLSPGRSYAFSVLGVNFNGQGEHWSDAAAFRACTEPSGVGIPRVTA